MAYHLGEPCASCVIAAIGTNARIQCRTRGKLHLYPSPVCIPCICGGKVKSTYVSLGTGRSPFDVDRRSRVFLECFDNTVLIRCTSAPSNLYLFYLCVFMAIECAVYSSHSIERSFSRSAKKCSSPLVKSARCLVLLK